MSETQAVYVVDPKLSKEDQVNLLASIAEPEELLGLANSKAHAITEHFYSFQGEGQSQGRPAYFIRYSKCNFRCSWCDSKRTWLNKNTETADDLLAAVTSSNAGLVVITGGEPLLYRHQPHFVAFILYLKAIGYDVEIETDGAFLPPAVLLGAVDQWNVSPKLGTSGVPLTDKYFEALVGWGLLVNNFEHNIWFKFVVQNELDFMSIQDYEHRFAFPRERIWFMPEGNTIAAQLEHMPYVVDKALEHGYRVAMRAHILVWNDKEGV